MLYYVSCESVAAFNLNGEISRVAECRETETVYVLPHLSALAQVIMLDLG